MDSAANTNKVLIIDDHQLFADGLALLLSQLGNHIQTSQYADAQQVLENEALWRSADLIIIDLHMPRFNGYAFLQSFQDKLNTPNVVVISGVESKSEIERALALGASGFVPKDSPSAQMLKGIETVLRGERYLPEHWCGKIDWPSADQVTDEAKLVDNIGPRQIQVLKLLQDGLQNKQIALVLGVSVSTVKSHTQHLYRALNVSNRTAAIKVASEQGLL